MKAPGRVVLAVALAGGIGACRAETTGAAFPAPGSAAPAFSGTTFYEPGNELGGRRVALSQHRGENVLLSFWATWCGPCISEMPALDSFAVRNRHRLKMYGVLVSDSRVRARSWILSRGGVEFPMIEDRRRAMKRDYLVPGMPSMFLIGPDGRVVSYCYGCLHWLPTFDRKLDSIQTVAAR